MPHHDQQASENRNPAQHEKEPFSSKLKRAELKSFQAEAQARRKVLMKEANRLQ
jgi:hypothetical protein